MKEKRLYTQVAARINFPGSRTRGDSYRSRVNGGQCREKQTQTQLLWKTEEGSEEAEICGHAHI